MRQEHMKHILPILTLALLSATTTVSATGFFDSWGGYAGENGYSYYEKGKVGSVETTNAQQGEDTNWVLKTQTIEYANYNVIKTSDYIRPAWNKSVEYNSRFRIHVNQDNVDFYLYDFIDSLDENTGENSNSLKNMGVAEIGYRILDTGTNVTRAGKEFTRSLDPMEKDPNPEVTDHVTAGTTYDVTRNKYYLGTFNKGEEFEIYMSYSSAEDSGIWSETYNVADYAGDGTYESALPGGIYGAAPGTQPFLNVDTLMSAYKAGTFDFNYNTNTALKGISAKAMPLASLDPYDFTAGQQTRVVFGIQAVGAPLPGGLPIALIAGLFGLGFWYIRRRKAVAA